MSVQRINKSNLLEKICFVLIGAKNEENWSILRQELSEYRSYRGDDLLSRQTVTFWFTKNSKPSRLPAFRFLLMFINNKYDRTTSSEDQSKVYYQVEEFLSQNIASLQGSPQEKGAYAGISTTAQGNILLLSESIEDDVDQFLKSWRGVYISFRQRLINDGVSPVSREVVRISRKNKSAKYQHWHRREGVDVERFSGFISPKTTNVWFFGVNHENSRLRICQFRTNNTISPKYQRIRWGLMHSDVPMVSSNEPCSERIILFRYDRKIKNFQDFVEKVVGYIEYEKIPEHVRDIVERAIDGSVSSESVSGKTDPIEGVDHILKINQRTTEMMCDLLDERVISLGLQREVDHEDHDEN